MKKTVRSNSDADETVFVFLVSDKEAIDKLEWEGDDEFRIDGEMYDVIEKKIVNNKLIIRCISDKKETALICKFEKMNNEHNSKNKSALLIKLFSSSYLPTEDTELFKKSISVPSIIYLQSEIISQGHDVLTPPPQVS